jgi:hypothetical protein
MSKRVSIAKYHSSIKWDIVSNISLPKKCAVLDLAIGRGGDLFKYTSRKEVDLILGVDIDNSAINEAKKRWTSPKNKAQDTTKLHLLAEDAASSKVGRWVGLKTRRKFGLTVCNFAIHYFFKSRTKLESLIETMSILTKKGGVVWVTCPDGGKLLDLLNGKEQISTPAYKLRKLKLSSTSAYGNSIEYKLNKTRYFTKAKPGKDIMSDSGVSSEYLVDVDELIAVMGRFKLKLVQKKHFSEWSHLRAGLNKFEKEISYTNISLLFEKI